MKAEELRIGNLVAFSNNKLWKEGVAGTTNVVDAKFILNYSQSSGQEFFEPIALTKEWLTKAGFVQGDDQTTNRHFWNKSVTHLEFSVNPDNGKCFIQQREDNICVQQDIKYIHQLQNLYFALTGTELIIVKQ